MYDTYTLPFVKLLAARMPKSCVISSSGLATSYEGFTVPRTLPPLSPRYPSFNSFRYDSVTSSGRCLPTLSSTLPVLRTPETSIRFAEANVDVSSDS